ncbi:Hypp5331 [Branchiostoma lanceolatum]|uniref:Hypp5331 protein n=1 Tax=Branchiostoma lanceolatum TaxID=7740 RepID=A0A8K0AFS8_BRALA|nr:Hypp5331 [Branchiostoma lanceolatum]
MTSAEIRGTLYGKVRRYLATPKKQVRFNVNLLSDHEEDLVKELQLWKIQQCDPGDFRPAESEVWLERYDGRHRHPPVQMGEGEFWDFVFSDRWDDYSSLRISEGALLQRLIEVFYALKRQGKLHEFETDVLEAKTKGQTKYDMRFAFIYYGLASGRRKGKDVKEPTTSSPETSPHLALFRSDPLLVERSVENLVSFLSKRSMSWPSDLATAATTSSNIQTQSRSLTGLGDNTPFNMDRATDSRNAKKSPGSSTGGQTAKSCTFQLEDSSSFFHTSSSSNPDVFSFSSGTSSIRKESSSEIEFVFGTGGSKGKSVCFEVQALLKPESSTAFVPPRPVSPHPSKHRQQSGGNSGQSSDKEHCYPRVPPTFVTPRKDKASLTVLQSSDENDNNVGELPRKAKVLDIVTRLKEAQRLKKSRRQAVSAEESESIEQIPIPENDLEAITPRSILRQYDNNCFLENSTSQDSTPNGEDTPSFFALNRTYSFDKLRERRKLDTDQEESFVDEEEGKLPELSVLLGHYALSRRRHLTTDTTVSTKQDFFPRMKEEDFVDGCLKALEDFVVRKEQAVVHVGRTVVRVVTTITINKAPLLKRS